MNSGSVCRSSKCSPPPPNLFLSCTLLAVPVGSTLCMTFVSMATWVLLLLIPFDTCLWVWYYCCALLWFCWGVWHGLSESKTSIPFSYNFVVAIIICSPSNTAVVCRLHFCYCELCECKLLISMCHLLLFQEMQVATDTTSWIVVDPSPPLLSFGAHLHVNSRLPYAARPQWPDCQTSELLHV